MPNIESFMAGLLVCVNFCFKNSNLGDITMVVNHVEDVGVLKYCIRFFVVNRDFFTLS